MVNFAESTILPFGNEVNCPNIACGDNEPYTAYGAWRGAERVEPVSKDFEGNKFPIPSYIYTNNDVTLHCKKATSLKRP